MNVKLIRAVSEDAERLLEIQKACFALSLKRYEDYETNPSLAPLEKVKWKIENENFYKIYYNDLWVGSINIRKLEDKKYKLHVINILPEYQNMGIGQKAIKLAEELFLDAEAWRLETMEDMPANRHVYEKSGYKFTGEIQVINDKLNIVFYEKNVR